MLRKIDCKASLRYRLRPENLSNMIMESIEIEDWGYDKNEF